MKTCVSFLGTSFFMSGGAGRLIIRPIWDKMTSCAHGWAVSLCIWVREQGRPAAVRGRKYCAWVGKGGLTRMGRTLLCFLFLTAFPRAVTAIAQLPVGENLGYWVSTCQDRQTGGSKVSNAAVRAEPRVYVRYRPLLNSVPDLKPLKPRWSCSLWGGKTGNCHLDKSCPGPKPHRRVICGDFEGSGLEKRQNDVMRWYL